MAQKDGAGLKEVKITTEKKKDKKRKKAELGKRKTQAAGPRPSLRPPIDARYCNAILGKMRGKRQGERGEEERKWARDDRRG